jgi:SAM-dependent methyltransferase
MNSKTSKLTHVPVLEEDHYIQERLKPDSSNPLYLHLSDLRLGLDKIGPFNEPRVLDYGCGGSPYRSLFNAATYHRADIAGTPEIDFPFNEDSRTSAPSQFYDIVLSTQVLEHVRDVQTYLAECHRLLAPGGRLVLSTHGVFHDHGCPWDFRRWTVDGLRHELTCAGFKVDRLFKLTTGPRAIAQLNQHYHKAMVPREKSVMALAWRLSWSLYAKTRRRLNAFLDREYKQHRVVEASEAGHDFYIAILVEAHRQS